MAATTSSSSSSDCLDLKPLDLGTSTLRGSNNLTHNRLPTVLDPTDSIAGARSSCEATPTDAVFTAFVSLLSSAEHLSSLTDLDRLSDCSSRLTISSNEHANLASRYGIRLYLVLFLLALRLTQACKVSRPGLLRPQATPRRNMSRPDSRGASIPPPPHSSAMSKTDESSSSMTPGGAPENSVAYQYVAVQQMTSNRDHIEYQLTVREQPKQSRMCGVGEKADRRPIDPAPIVQLRVITHDRPIRQNDIVDSASVAPPVERRPGHGPKLPKTPGVRRGLPVSTALGDGWEDKAWYLENPYFFMYAMLCNADTDEELHLLNDGKTRYTSGSCVSCLYHLKDIDGSHQGFFVFPDLSIRVEGRYRLKLCLFETIGHSVHHCKSIYSDPFHVYTAKRFPGMEESTKLSKSFAEQGLKVRVRKHPRSRRRSSKRTKEESDASDTAPLPPDRSPKRARASDHLPVSGLPIPQPLTARMPRSVDSPYQIRLDQERRSTTSTSPQDLKRAPMGRHAGWEEEEAVRLSEVRSRDAGYDQGLYTRHARDEKPMERPLASQPYGGRYVDGYTSREHLTAPPPHHSMSTRGLPEYAEYGRPGYVRTEQARPLLSSPHPAATPPPPHSPRSSLAARGLAGPSISLAGPHRSGWADPPPPPAAMVSRSPRAPSRAYGHPDQVAYESESARAYDDYAASARYGPRYSAPYDQRDGVPGRRSLSPLPPGSVEYGSRGVYAPPTASRWRPGPPSPGRKAEYYSAPFERDLSARRPSPQPALRDLATPPAAFVSESSAYTRRGYAAGESSRAAQPGASMRPPPASLEPYGQESGLRPSDLPPPSERLGSSGVGLGSRERPMLPPLSASSPSMAPRDASKRYFAPSGYLASVELAERERERERERQRSEREWDRERLLIRAQLGPPPIPKDGYSSAASGWVRHPPSRSTAGRPARPQ